MLWVVILRPQPKNPGSCIVREALDGKAVASPT